ncbi:hypothetical protein PN36_21040 [Candidatus Thiomargarita nelsonii]|uniref:Secreted protein n=1 Tax=Candidatus Thiomargarita nelsonii TaxID=1003181 RepID=A0A0A6P8W0_9GAMM|nr:hypothetical protein PN36_21040 [Candidatus Thiomargarita nelsonii]
MKTYQRIIFATFLATSTLIAAQEPPLLFEQVDQFTLIWSARGTGGEHEGAYYKPIAPPGYHILGHYGQGNYGTPDGFSVVVKEKYANGNPALKRPEKYEEIWADFGSGAQRDGAFWQPIPPEGYKCLGIVVTPNYKKPSTNEIRCVRDDLTTQGKIGQLIWNDSKTAVWFRDFGSWRIEPANPQKGKSVGTFYGHASQQPPSSIELRSTELRVLNSSQIRLEQ